MRNWEINQLIKRMHKLQESGRTNHGILLDNIRERLAAWATRLEVFADWKPWSRPAKECLRRANDIRWALLPT